MRKIAIIMPAYNEEKRIGRTLEEFREFFGNLKRKEILDFRIIIVINNTIDNTEEVVKKYQKTCREIEYLNFKQRGKGFAITEGFKEAIKSDFDLIGFVDADLSTSAKDFYDLIVNMSNYDGIIASRYIKGARVMPKQPLPRIIVSRLGNWIIKVMFLLPFKDTQCGAKVFTKKAIEKTVSKLKMTQWAFDVNLLYQIKKEGFRVREYPTIWKDSEQSHLKLRKASVQVFLAILQLRILNSPFYRFLKLIRPIIGFVWKRVK